LRAKFESFGISDGSRIVLYFGRDGGLASTTRIIFTLEYLGLGSRTSLLNGGMSAWKRANKPVTSAPPSVTPGKLSARPTRNIVVDAEFVKNLAKRPNHRLVDARAPVFYSGVQATHGKSGHIPGSVNIPFSQILDNQLMIDLRRIETLFRGAGVKEGETIVGYCHIGQQATAMIFGARLLGHPVLLYDGSFHDWAMNDRGPVEK
jgi:thiosulfate/3-mercaptopyruvate sulfurtransferase